MSYTIDNITNEYNGLKSNDYISLSIRGTPENGLDKSIVNAIRRTIMTDIPIVAFRVERENSDIVFEINKSSLHNEYILDRLALIPLSIDPEKYQKNEYLFILNVKDEKDDKPIKQVTSNDFEIYKINADVKGRDIDITELDNYTLLNQNLKDKILNPFKINYSGKQNTEYCIITELKSNNVSGDLYSDEELKLYGTPSISSAKENAAWSGVSHCIYTFHVDEARLKKALEDKKSIENITSNIKEFEEEFIVNEGERYYYLDNMMQPYYYTFSIEKVGFYDPKTIFIKGCEYLLKRINEFKEQIDILNLPECRIKILNSETISGGFSLKVDGETDTLGSIIQSHIVRKYIDVEREDSPIMFCGYKRIHPLEERIQFTIKMKTDGAKIIPGFLSKICLELEEIVQRIHEEAQAKL